MPYLEQNEIVRLKDEAAKVRILNQSLEEKEGVLSKYKKQRTVLLAIAVVGFLVTIIFFFSFSPNKGDTVNNFLVERNLDTINMDTLTKLKSIRFQYNNLLENQPEESDEASKSPNFSFEDQEVVYSVQLGAYENFNIELLSEGFNNVAEENKSGINKYSVGNFTTYEDVYTLKQDLIKLGFKDCFVIAQSFGNDIEIRDALALSGEDEKY